MSVCVCVCAHKCVEIPIVIMCISLLMLSINTILLSHVISVNCAINHHAIFSFSLNFVEIQMMATTRAMKRSRGKSHSDLVSSHLNLFLKVHCYGFLSVLK